MKKVKYSPHSPSQKGSFCRCYSFHHQRSQQAAASTSISFMNRIKTRVNLTAKSPPTHQQAHSRPPPSLIDIKQTRKLNILSDTLGTKMTKLEDDILFFSIAFFCYPKRGPLRLCVALMEFMLSPQSLVPSTKARELEQATLGMESKI